MDTKNVLDWEKRPKRIRKPPPLTYWDEYVATDQWYLNELIADIPDEEYDAAVHDEDWKDDELSDASMCESNGSDDQDEGGDDEWTDESSVGSTASASASASADDVSTDESSCSDCCFECDDDEPVEPTGKRQRRS